MKFAICQELFEGWDWERQCKFSAEVGYTGLEVAPFTLASRITDVSSDTLATMKQQAADCGLTVIGLHWLLAKTEGLHLTTMDQPVRDATADYLGELAKACHALGGDIMVFGSPPQRNLQDGVSMQQALENATDVFKKCMPILGDHGVKLCMEPLTSNETDFIRTCADAMQLIEMVDHPNFILHQDVKAMSGAETDPIPDLIHRHKDMLGHFHVNDTNLLGPGMGKTNFAPIFQALQEVEYDGWVSVEVFDYSPGCEHIARTSYEYMQSVLP